MLEVWREMHDLGFEAKPWYRDCLGGGELACRTRRGLIFWTLLLSQCKRSVERPSASSMPRECQLCLGLCGRSTW